MGKRSDVVARAVSIGVVAVGLVIVGALSFGSVVPGPVADAPAPLSPEERDQRRADFIDALWAPVGEEYPEAIRPEVDFGRVVDDRGGRAAQIECLGRSGITATVDRGRVVYQSGQGQTPVDLAVASYACAARHPNIRDVTAGLSSDQLGQLWDHYSTVTRPCLAAIGQSTWLPPSREAYRADDGHHTWNPYLPLRGSGRSEAKLDALEARCPSVPAWLDYRSE